MKIKNLKVISLIIAAAALISVLGVTLYGAFTSPEASDYNIIENGKSDYVILIPADADDDIKTAASEITTMIEMSTGVVMETVSDDNIGDRSEKIISLGNTSLFAKSGIKVSDYNIGERGYVLKTIGSNMFIASNMSFGVLCGAYDMLTATIGYEAYSYDEIVVDEMSTVALLEFDTYFKPLIDNRQTSYYELRNSAIYRYRMKLTSQVDQWSAFAHTMITVYCPTSPYLTSNPEWYGNTSGKQICYGLALDQEDPDGRALLSHIIEQVYSCLTNSGGKNKTYIMLGNEDNFTVCTCDRCQSIMDEYGGQASGGYAALQMELTNLVAEKVDAKLAADGDTRTIQYGTFAYQTCRSAPAVWDEAAGKYVPSSDRFYVRDNTFILYAPIEMDFSHPVNSDENNGIYTDLIKWRDILAYDNENNHEGETGANTADNIMIWSYCIPKQMFTALPNFGTYFTYYKEFADCGVSYIYDQSYGKTGLAAFSALKIYTQSKAMYSNEYDYNELAYDFIHQYYDLAGESMYEYYNYLISYYAYLQDEKGMGGSIWEDLTVAKNWSVPVLNKMISYIDEAVEAIEPLKSTDPDRYQLVYDRLMREKCSPMYILFYRFEQDMSIEERQKYILELEKYTKQFDMNYSYENAQDVADRIAMWKANLGL